MWKKAHLISDFMKKKSPWVGLEPTKRNKNLMKAYEDLETRILPSNIFHCTNFSIPRFKGLGMRNLQYWIRICQKSCNTVTNHNYILCVVRISMKQTLLFHFALALYRSFFVGSTCFVTNYSNMSDLKRFT